MTTGRPIQTTKKFSVIRENGGNGKPFVIEADEVIVEGPWVVFKIYDPIDGTWSITLATRDVMDFWELRE